MPKQVEFDDSQGTRLVEIPSQTTLAETDVRVAVSRAGVNFWEVMQRRGSVPPPKNRVPGTEGAGVVVGVGSAVTPLTLGQRVAWSKVPGSWSESLVAPASSLTPIPDMVTDEVAASLLFQATTAYYLCHETWRVQAGDVAVVTAAAGGVGQLLIQLLVASGARVIGVVSTAAKAAAASAAGASEVLLYGDDLARQVRELVPTGVAAVYDAVGNGVAEPLLATLRPRGAMVLYGSASGANASISATDLGAGSYFLTRTAGRDYLGNEDDQRERAELLMSLAASGSLRPMVGATYSLADAGRALDDMESRQSVGKLLLQP